MIRADCAEGAGLGRGTGRREDGRPRRLASIAAVSPTDDVPPRISSVWPRSTSSPAVSAPVRGLQCFRHRAQGRPRQLTAEGDRLRDGHACELRVAAVEAATHAAHHRDDLLTDRELTTRTGSHDSGRLDSQDARQRDLGIGEPEPGLQLGAIQTEGLRLDENPARLGARDRTLAYNERRGERRDRVQDDGADGGGNDHVVPQCPIW